MKEVWLATIFTATLFLVGCGGSTVIEPEEPGNTIRPEPPSLEVNPDLRDRLPGYVKPPREEIIPPRGSIEPSHHSIIPGHRGSVLPPRHIKDPHPQARSTIKPHILGGAVSNHK